MEGAACALAAALATVGVLVGAVVAVGFASAVAIVGLLRLLSVRLLPAMPGYRAPTRTEAIPRYAPSGSTRSSTA